MLYSVKSLERGFNEVITNVNNHICFFYILSKKLRQQTQITKVHGDPKNYFNLANAL